MVKIAVFASGNGSNFEAIASGCADGSVKACCDLCVCDKPGAGVVSRARRLGVDVLELSVRDFPSKTDYERCIADELDRRGIQLVCLAGYMRLIGSELLSRYEGRIVNIHPALLPAFPGAHAIDDAMAYGVKVYGVTIHYVDSGIDSGKIIAQVPVCYDGNDRDVLEPMIHRAEHKLYKETINKLIENESTNQCKR